MKTRNKTYPSLKRKSKSSLNVSKKILDEFLENVESIYDGEFFERVPIEDDAVITTRGIEWLYPINPRMLVIK